MIGKISPITWKEKLAKLEVLKAENVPFKDAISAIVTRQGLLESMSHANSASPKVNPVKLDTE